MDIEGDRMVKVRSYKKDKNGREIYTGDKVKGLFLFGMPVLGICEFSEKHSAFGLRWNRGCVEEFTAFCQMCNIEYEVIESEDELLC